MAEHLRLPGRHAGFYCARAGIGVNNNGETFQPKGYALVFHPDLIHGTALGKHIQEYTFFGYQSNEALHLSEREKKIVLDCFSKIEYELEHAIDKHSKRLIVIQH